MRNLGPTIFQEDTVLTEPLIGNGPLRAYGNLKGPSFRINGPFDVESNIEVQENLRVNGPSVIHGSLICHLQSRIRINGPLTVHQGIKGGFLRINGPLSTRFAEVGGLQIHGSVEIEDDLKATHEISITLGHLKAKKKLRVGGIVSAPYVHIKDPGSWINLIPGMRIFRRTIGLRSVSRSKFQIRNLRIFADRLVLEGVELLECDINVKEMENVE
ncbi:MAG: hypothetical protein ACFFFG_06920 [Candidatus Thorarchaeota archaeon]